MLRAAGFRTAAFTGVDVYMNPRFGLGRGFERYVIGQTDAVRDNVSRIEWLREQAALGEADPEHRFFMFAHYFDVHSDVDTEVPYVSPPDDRDRYLGTVLKPAVAALAGLVPWAPSGISTIRRSWPESRK